MKYLLAKYGFGGTMTVLKINGITVSNEDNKDDKFYTFKKHNIFVSVPKWLFDNDVPTQSMVYTIISSIEKTDKAEIVYTKDFWLRSLGKHFNSATEDKGYDLLESLTCVYDISTKESIHLPEKDKEDIFKILTWIIREFPNLRGKNNMDLSTKRIRLAEYFSAMYAMKIAGRIYNISNLGKNVQITDIEKAVYTQPNLLIKRITKDSLVNYCNSVNDLDSISALKFSFKGISGLGDGSSVPSSYRMQDKSYIGRLDLDSSSHSDPGMSGVICPMAVINNHCFSDYQEPNNWRNEVDQMIQTYKDLEGYKDILTFQDEIGLQNDDGVKEIVNENINQLKRLFVPVKFLDMICD